MLSQNIQKVIPRVIAYLSTQPVVRKAWIFGSCAKGEENSKSDVDFLVDYDRTHRLSMLTLGGIISNLENLFGRDIDLVENGYLIPEAQQSANREKVLIYEREDTRPSKA